MDEYLPIQRDIIERGQWYRNQSAHMVRRKSGGWATTLAPIIGAVLIFGLAVRLI